MSKPSGITESEPKRKTWRVLEKVPSEKLEETLNQLADDGYQVFRLERTDRVYNDSGCSVTFSVYDVVAFDPMLLGERVSKAFTASVIAQIAEAQTQVPMPGPAPGG